MRLLLPPGLVLSGYWIRSLRQPSRGRLQGHLRVHRQELLGALDGGDNGLAYYPPRRRVDRYRNFLVKRRMTRRSDAAAIETRNVDNLVPIASRCFS